MTLPTLTRQNANICIYPRTSQVTVTGSENITEYRFERKFTGHRFCKICGVQMYMKLHGPPKELLDTWSPERQRMVQDKVDIVPVRCRGFDGIEWSEDQVERSNVGTDGYDPR
ncbi:hypothetical protein G647_02750 [Cladophialophora carrionii CBS 160.54]|uniref:CENP-V/GFA domain-containing protein n=1 Tax=Cladophialophora carrionii CBS 160.54 TaxID=1279043 RepID=V9DI34_9EURO|nr:uncharacterized protein G647_02750 [Cladophialophora carrionii CBS 160.54]ETI25973.1 hypothetical protein G647_02750 [Cladophialophora carrionii CBS 160.54]